MALKQKSDIAAGQHVSLIGFVWRPEEITPAVLHMARRTGSRAVIDCSRMGVDGLRAFLGKADLVGSVRDIRVSATACCDPALGQVLKEAGIREIWVECPPHLLQGDPADFLQRFKELSENHHMFPITGDPVLLAAFVRDFPGTGRVVLKGCEASGFVSAETTMALYALVKEMLAATAKPLDIIIWGGVFTPEAAAAFLTTGASGIVFECVHWLTDLVAVDEHKRQMLSRLRLDSTELVGLGLQVPCRLFNKGNSRAFKEIKAFEDSLFGAARTQENRSTFERVVHARAIHPLESHFRQDEVIPLGVEAAFAASFVERFGNGTEEAVKAFMENIRTLCRQAVATKDCFLDSPAAGEMGTRYPFIQGAMSWITDVPEFALRVADAGGLPTIALGMMDAETLDRRLGRLPEIMGGRPYAVNIVSLAENPFRETQLAWIKKQRPRFAVIAGGDLSSVRELMECGIGIMYIAPDEALLRLALEVGVKYVIFEGYEAGGHVGQQSMLTLAQMVLDLKRRTPSLFQGCRMVFAGGIYNRETAAMAAMLGAEAIQMGTAYLATREIIETGALTELYQRMVLKSPPGGTVVSGQDTGLRVRSLRSPGVEAILSLEREFAAGHQDEASFRTKMEEMAAGSLFAAARGKDRRCEAPLDEQACLERGQFMSGACAGLIDRVRELDSFHRELAEGPLLLQQPLVGEVGNSAEPLLTDTPSLGSGHGRTHAVSPVDAHERIAITGMSVLNSLGASPEEIWDASLAMKSGISAVPSSRWDHAIFYDPRPLISDKTYCTVGAFVDFPISRSDLGIPPQDFRSMTSSTKLTMWLADKAIRESGILGSGIPAERIGVIISQNSGEAAGTLTNIIIRAYTHDILTAVKRAIHLTPDQESAIEREVRSGRMAPDDTTLLGRLNCAAAGFICNRYGFMGPSFAVSAACSTSLVAIYSAVQMIRNGVIDAAIVGGGEDSLTHLHFLEFSAVGALYGLSGRQRPPHETSRPFDAQRDGMVLGEGGGMIVIERESMARARGARVHSVITGMGASNNHMGMVESNSVTQEIAIRASFQGVPYGPDAVDLVECHATSTRQGDVEEVRALKTFFSPSRRTVLTSFKSQIGHTLGASGITNLIRGTMAMKTGIFPPTLNYEYPDPDMGLEGSGLIIAPEPFDWKSDAGRPRRLQVNAFGFGGSNYVVQLEQSPDDMGTVMVGPYGTAGLAGEKGSAPPAIEGISFFRTEMAGRTCRMAVVAHSRQEALTIIEQSTAHAEAGIDSPKVLRSLAQQGIFISPENLPLPPLALVFPGQGAQYQGMGRDLYDSFPVIREWLDRAAAAADFDMLHLMFHDQEKNLQKTRWQQPAMFAMEHAMARYLIALGVHPVAMAGHSLGELTALCLAGVFSPEDGFHIVNKRAICMDKAAGMNVEPGVMAAVDAPLDLLKEMLQGQENVYIGNINSPVQVVLSGNSKEVGSICLRLKDMGYRATPLRVSMAFHSPIMRVIRDELAAFVASIPVHPPRIPVISNTTMEPYPSDPDEIRRILMSHLESPVHWMNNVQTLWDDFGIRLFTEVGPGEALSNLIMDTVPEPACIQTCHPSSESLSFRTALARLYVLGHLQVEGVPRFVSLSAPNPPLESLPIAPSAAARPSEDRGSGVSEGWKQAAPVTSVTATRDPATARMGQTSPGSGEASGVQAVMESLIHIIMDATGFERDEIQPDMELKRDLSIRSSRLPIIMDAAERRFGITIEMEDFIDVRTVMDIAGRISRLVDAQGGIIPRPDATARTGQTPPACDETPEGNELMESLIHIIMDATGFERDEIQPDMELKKDLSIRSSRLPIIMDAAERRFGITIEMEDFIDVRTVKDIAQRIATISATQGGAAPQPDNTSGVPDPARDEITAPPKAESSLKRLVFQHAPVVVAGSLPLELSAGDSVFLLSPDRDDAIAGKVGEIIQRNYGVDTIPLFFMPGDPGSGEERCDLLTDEGSVRAAEIISGRGSLTGLVIALSHVASEKGRMAEVAQLLRGFLPSLKAFLTSPEKKFVLLIHSRKDSGSLVPLLAEGMLGLFLSAALEYPSVQFRTLEVDRDTDLHVALRAALDRGCTQVEMIDREGKLFTSEGQPAPSVFQDSPRLNLNPGDVVVMSGGATGISAHLAHSLIPFTPRLVFLGRTSLDSGSGRVAEIARNLTDLRSSGIEASYHTCDVTDPEAVRAVLGEVSSRYGRIDGIVHGAGVLRDGFLNQMSQEDFSTVTDVKFTGAWNLFTAAQGAGLRFFVGLSSAAAIQGNPGQANYAAANRMMSALLGTLQRDHSAILFKALMLPPVEGAGMADDPELRELLKRKGVAYIHAGELAALFCRELFAAPSDDVWVMFMRGLPSLKTALLNDATVPAHAGELAGGTVSMAHEDFPLIDRISLLDIRREELEVFRSFSQEKDLWITDHRPFAFVKHPLVSAAMILETFMEAARILYPHLQVRGVRQVRLLNMIQCPPGVPRPSRIICSRAGNGLREVVCDVSLETQDLSPAGRLTDHLAPHCTGQVILNGGAGLPLEEFADFPVRTDELLTGPMDHAMVLSWYKEHSGLDGRYRVMEFLDGAGPGVVRGRTTYRETGDFSHLRSARYQYSPYLFEALLQLVAFHIAATDPSERRSIVPLEIGEMRFSRKCRAGERLIVEARLRAQNKDGLVWDARGIDDQGQTVMQVRNMGMHWVAE